MEKFKWTDEKIEILIKYYPTREYDKMFEELNYFNLDNIRHKAKKLGIKVVEYNYTNEDIAFIEKNFKTMKYEEMSKILGKTISSIQSKIRNLGLIKSAKWTEEELELLREVYPYYPNEYLERKYFIGRKSFSIRNMALKIGLHKKEDNFLFYNPQDIIERLSDLATKLGRTPLIDELIPNNLPSERTYNRYFGGYRNACELAGLEINCDLFGNAKKYYSSNKDLCFSKSELIITEFFIKNNMWYTKDTRYSEIISDKRCGTKRTDWVLKDGTIVEFWGFPKFEGYVDGMNLKIRICKENNLNLIELFRKDLTKLHNIFSQYL